MATDDEKVVKEIVPETVLPSPIDDLPVYHIPNFDEPGAVWGSSEMRGLERVMAAVDQGISDEELVLVLEGLGVYATNAGSPQDPDTGEDLPWNLGPGRVVEVPEGSSFTRVSGINSVNPYQDHLKFIIERIDEAASTPAIAKGKVSDAQIAESGISLEIQHGPILATSGEKEVIVSDVLTNLLFNLPKWIVAYEGSAMNSLIENTRWIPVYGAKIPVNKQKAFENIAKAVTAKLIPTETAWDMMRKLGWELPDNATLQTAMDKQSAAELDAMASRISGELTDPTAGA